MKRNKRKKICIVATVQYALIMYMKPHIAMLAKEHDITLVANGNVEIELSSMLDVNVQYIPINLSRKISIFKDIVGLIKLYRLFRDNNFDVVHSLMPKTGLLAMLAACAAKVPKRIHTFTGQVWASKQGWSRVTLKLFDKLIAKCATNLLTDSFPQREFLIKQGIVVLDKIHVLGHGSTCGVNLDRFKPDLNVRNKIRVGLKIPENAIVYLFVGRLNVEKGVLDLAEAFTLLAKEINNIHLLLVGPDEGDMDNKLLKIINKFSGQYHRIGFTGTPEHYMAAADVFCLPSYREGFPLVTIEAAAVGVPAVASNIYGIIDSVKDGETGVLHPPGNIEQLKKSLLLLTTDVQLRRMMANQAMTRVHAYFTEPILVDEMRKYYQKLLSEQ